MKKRKYKKSIAITSVEYIAGYILDITFSDGYQVKMDFTPCVDGIDHESFAERVTFSDSSVSWRISEKCVQAVMAMSIYQQME